MTYIFAILVGFFMAIMDRTIDPIQFRVSILGKLNQKWWVRSVSSEYVSFIPGTRYRLDAWHIAKTLQIISIAGMAASCSRICLLQNPIWNWVLIVIVLASLITASFVLFYDYILKAETWQKMKNSKSTKSTIKVTKKRI